MWWKIIERAGSCSWDYLVKPVVILLRSVPNEVEILKGEHENLRDLITEADSEAASAEGDKRDQMRSTAQELRIIYFRIEDVFDEWNSYLSHEGVCGRLSIQAVDGWRPCGDGCVALPCEDVCLVNCMCCVRLQIAINIWNIKSDVGKLKERCEKDGIKTKSSSKQGLSSGAVNPDVAWKNLRRKPYSGQREVVGFEGPIRKLTDWLEDGRRPDCSVMVVVGMAGQGKTTLAKQIFDNREVIGKFKCSAWIRVSNFDDPKEFFRFMLRKLYQQTTQTLPGGFSKMGLQQLKIEVKKYLHKRRYVLFFDDVWSKNFWQEIEHVLSYDKYGSRIIITTRNKEVANACKKSIAVEVHQMQPLTEEASLEMFRLTAVVEDLSPNTNRYGTLSEEVVKACAGLPLGIVNIGKHISVCKEDVFRWKSKIEEAGITEILCLSYDNLPDHLKPCLLYFGIYPQHYQVKLKRLIRQWIAEGFVKEKNGSAIEEVAEDYLTCLVNRNLVQVSSFTIDGKPKSCHVHYLVHDMILRQFEDLYFCRCFNETNRLCVNGITRRLSIATNTTVVLHGFFDNLFVEGIQSSFIRSLHFFTKQNLSEEFVSRIAAKKRPLKVLDFEDCRLSSFAVENLENLIHLKYLSFRNTQIKCLPRFIGKLQNLETLDLRQTDVREIPKEVSKLRKLQHLLGDELSLIQLKDSIGDMKSLLTLRDVKLDDRVGLIEKELGKLWQIKDLGLTSVGHEHGSVLCPELDKMIHLEKLSIVAKSGNGVIDLQHLRNPSVLRRLCLKGKLNQLPDCIHLCFNRLAKLVLSGSKLNGDPLNSLKGIPNLSLLSIIDEAYEGESLVFQDTGFGDLVELELGSLHKLNSITIRSNSLPSLKKLRLRNIPKLKTVPSGIQHLKKLQDLNTNNMPPEFKQSIAPGGLQKHRIIKHVPHVRINGVLLKD